MREAVISKAWRTPWGTVIECKASLVLVGLGGCGWGLAPRLTIDELKALRAPDLPLPPKPPEQPEPPADENPPAAPGAQPVQP